MQFKSFHWLNNHWDMRNYTIVNNALNYFNSAC